MYLGEDVYACVYVSGMYLSDNIYLCVFAPGMYLSDNVYAWLAILILPINPAFNPLLYTLLEWRTRRTDEDTDSSTSEPEEKDEDCFLSDACYVVPEVAKI